ncbi:HXXEE domain-containing protein [Saccharicrinis sp. FJH54]|uniref:HXXEE domain-containing protein n=1 Tax=Saccharicrinis sp. FJH54 TaxID=3344665 RepID=UPI0035D4AD84
MDILFIVLIFPAVFMIHEFEEIIFMQSWVKRAEPKITSRLPNLGSMIIRRQKALSTAGFAFIVAEEFLLVTALTIMTYFTASYTLFMSLVLVYSLHLFVHIGQAIVLRSYIPALVTSLLTVVYGTYVIHFYISSVYFDPSAFFTNTIIVTLSAAGNLFLMHKLVLRLKL